MRKSRQMMDGFYFSGPLVLDCRFLHFYFSISALTRNPCTTESKANSEIQYFNHFNHQLPISVKSQVKTIYDLN